MSIVVLDLHGSRAQEGVDIDALESFLGHFRGALREYARAGQGAISRKGGRPYARESAAAAFRLTELHAGSAIATLVPSVPGDSDGADLLLDDRSEALAVATLRGLLDAVDADERLPDSVVEALSSARRAIGDDGSFGVKITDARQIPRLLIDEERMERLQRPAPGPTDVAVSLTGRLHMIEADPPNRRVGVRAQDGVDWTCTYPDHLHTLVTTLIERLVWVTGSGRRLTAATGRLCIDGLDPIAEYPQDALFTVETIPVDQLRAEQQITQPQGLGALVDEHWTDDEESRRFLEATLGVTQRP